MQNFTVRNYLKLHGGTSKCYLGILTILTIHFNWGYIVMEPKGVIGETFQAQDLIKISCCTKLWPFN